ncbi:hypothetical protein VCR29J2_670094 [Vibrio coralliirubri]|nr:hypothetical protein VCR29J2_670094 [Vibrio coralliirubri]
MCGRCIDVELQGYYLVSSHLDKMLTQEPAFIVQIGLASI